MITVHKVYTHPCTGTGGLSEYIAFYENGALSANGTWARYQGHWHNISISPSSLQCFQLLHTYNYTIRTGSYPQIIHESSKEVTGGKIVLNSRGLVLEEPSLSYVLRWITDLTAKGLMGWSQEKRRKVLNTPSNNI